MIRAINSRSKRPYVWFGRTKTGDPEINEYVGGAEIEKKMKRMSRERGTNYLWRQHLDSQYIGLAICSWIMHKSKKLKLYVLHPELLPCWSWWSVGRLGPWFKVQLAASTKTVHRSQLHIVFFYFIAPDLYIIYIPIALLLLFLPTSLFVDLSSL